MACVCNSCAATGTERCPRCGEDLTDVEFGCVNYVKLPVVHNVDKHSTRCSECRFLFQKPRKDAKDKSYINCGAVPSLVQHIKPIPNCPYFKQLRKKQQFRKKRKNSYKFQNKRKYGSGGYSGGYNSHSYNSNYNPNSNWR